MSRLLVSRNPDAPLGWRSALAILSLVVTAVAIGTWWNRPVSGAKPEPTGQEIFRFDTFGDEQLWTDQLRMHEVIESSIDPLTALALGLKVDVDALPESLRQAIAAGNVDLTDPATTVALIKLNAVVGIVGTLDQITIATD